jgi:hypothetical protein
MMNFCLGFMPIVRVFSLFFHVVPEVQFGSYIQVHVSKGWPHLLGFTGKC